VAQSTYLVSDNQSLNERPNAHGQQSEAFANKTLPGKSLSAALERDKAGGDLSFVSGEGCQDFCFLGFRDFEKVQGPSEFRRDFIELSRGDPEVPSRPRGVLPGLVAVNLKGPPETSQTQSVRMNLRPGSLPRFLVCHFRSCGFLDFLPTIGFFTTASLK
jgi:hypothetical protein